MRTPWRHFNWNLRSCGWRGHVTYRPSEPDLAERISAATAVGEAWRCLRCGDFVLGAPHGTGPASEAPLVLQGKALQDAAILRLLAAERFVRGILLVLLAYGVYRFNGSRQALRQVFETYLPLLRPVAEKMNVDLESSGPVHLIERVLATNHQTLVWITVGVLGYGALQLTEGVGLWLMRRWGEYVAVVGTSLFIPLEAYELSHRVTVTRLVAFVVNLAAVFYLVWSKRLFGFRGGHAAFEAARRDASLLEVETAAVRSARPSAPGVPEPPATARTAPDG